MTPDEEPVRVKGKRGRGGKPSAIDAHVGSRVRLRRTMLAMSQEKLGEALGLTFQQVQKYERGTNRIGASRLLDIARVLDVPVSFFYDDLPADLAVNLRPPGLSEAQAEYKTSEDPMLRQETLELIRNYYRIKSDAVRTRLFDLIKGMAYEGTQEIEGIKPKAVISA